MKRPHFLLAALVIILALTAGTFYYLDWRIPRATATIQILPSVMAVSPGGDSSSPTHNMNR